MLSQVGEMMSCLQNLLMAWVNISIILCLPNLNSISMCEWCSIWVRVCEAGPGQDCHSADWSVRGLLQELREAMTEVQSAVLKTAATLRHSGTHIKHTFIKGQCWKVTKCIYSIAMLQHYTSFTWHGKQAFYKNTNVLGSWGTPVQSTQLLIEMITHY